MFKNGRKLSFKSPVSTKNSSTGTFSNSRKKYGQCMHYYLGTTEWITDRLITFHSHPQGQIQSPLKSMEGLPLILVGFGFSPTHLDAIPFCVCCLLLLMLFFLPLSISRSYLMSHVLSEKHEKSCLSADNRPHPAMGARVRLHMDQLAWSGPESSSAKAELSLRCFVLSHSTKAGSES